MYIRQIIHYQQAERSDRRIAEKTKQGRPGGPAERLWQPTDCDDYRVSAFEAANQRSRGSEGARRNPSQSAQAILTRTVSKLRWRAALVAFGGVGEWHCAWRHGGGESLRVGAGCYTSGSLGISCVVLKLPRTGSTAGITRRKRESSLLRGAGAGKTN
jgi:hypothetical protein